MMTTTGYWFWTEEGADQIVMDRLQTSEELQDKTSLLIHQLVLVYWRVVPQTISFYNPEPY
jgi:hypothetical protein